jgi:hypothetical protein
MLAADQQPAPELDIDADPDITEAADLAVKKVCIDSASVPTSH